MLYQPLQRFDTVVDMAQNRRSVTIQGAPYHQSETTRTDAQGTGYVWTRNSHEDVTIEHNKPRESDVSTTDAHQTEILHHARRFTGWRFGAFAAAGLALTCLIINIVATSWIVSHVTFEQDLAELYHGDCGRVKHINTAVHLIINIVSSLLLGGSNYCMQCLVAPTRSIIDNAHRHRRWLEIGVPSIRNLRSAPILHVILWFLLLISSLPLHLMYVIYIQVLTNQETDYARYNSSVYPSLATYQYHINISNSQNTTHDDFLNDAQWDTLTNAECIRTYNNDFISDRSNLTIVTTAESNLGYFNTTISFQSGLRVRPSLWICSNTTNWSRDFDLGGTPCDRRIPQILASPDTWAPFGYPARYCLSQRVPPLCGLNANVSILVTVIACNLLKCLIMAYIAFFLDDNPLMVIGDAVESFIHERDIITRTAGLISQHDIQGPRHTVRFSPKHQHQHQRQFVTASDTRFKTRYPRRWSVVGRVRWCLVMVPCCLSIGGALALLAYGLADQFADSSIGYLWGLGYGEVNSVSLISTVVFASYDYSEGNPLYPYPRPDNNKSVLKAVLTANASQLLLSILYFNLNVLMTRICLAVEWAKFSTRRDMLRVSRPRGRQKSTYFLSIPYRYAVPLLVASVSLHWSISQSIFLAVINEVRVEDGSRQNVAITCGYSPIAIITTCVLGGLVLLAVIGVGFPQIKGDIPLVGTCSIAISAACHPPETESNLSSKAIQWGVISGSANDAQQEHCALSTGEVGQFVPGRQYW